jgi:putative tricarboxylic transport membrane protein
MTDPSLGRRKVRIKSPQDFWGGFATLGIAIFAWIIAFDLSGVSGFQFGSGTTPRLFAGFLAVMSIAVIVVSLIVEGPSLERLGLRAPFFITSAAIAFAFTVRPLGLVISGFAAALMAAFATSEVRPVEAVVFAAFMTAFCALVFILGLGLPMPLWPGS